MYSVQTAVSDGTLNRIVLGIEFIDIAHIHVYRSDIPTELIVGVDFTWDGIIALNLTQVVPSGITITVLRRTTFGEILNLYAGGAPFLRVTLDENFQQLLYIVQEGIEAGLTTDYYQSLNMHQHTVSNLKPPVDSTDAATKGYVDSVDATLSTRVTAIENLGQGGGVPWTQTIATPTTTLTPPYIFSSAELFIDGVAQRPLIDFQVTGNTITLNGGTLYSGQVVLAYLQVGV